MALELEMEAEECNGMGMRIACSRLVDAGLYVVLLRLCLDRKWAVV